MQKSEIKYVGFSTKLLVKEDCIATGTFGTFKNTLKKREKLICVKVVEDKNDIFFEALTTNEDLIVVHYDQVEFAEKPDDIEKTKPIMHTKDLYPGIELIVVGEKSVLGVGTKVTFSHVSNGIFEPTLAVMTSYEGNQYINIVHVSLSQLAIPFSIFTNSELIANLINFIENNEPLISKEKTINLLKTIK